MSDRDSRHACPVKCESFGAQSEERFRLIVETAQEGVVCADTDYRITYANPRMHSMLGYQPGELLGRALEELLVPEDVPIFELQRQRRLEGVSEQYEIRFRCKKGPKVWTLINASPVKGPDGAFAGSLGMVTDITDRVRVEAKLRKNETHYRQLVESMREGLLMTGKSGRFCFINNQFAAMLGRSKAGILGHHIEEFAAPESRERLLALFSENKSGQETEEIIWIHKSGRRIVTLVSPSMILDEKGRLSDAFALTTDTTERKTLENQLLQSQKLEAIGQLAAGIAHEINTPAQYVNNNIHFIKDAFEHLLPLCCEFRRLLEAAKTGCVSQEMVQDMEAAIAKHDLAYFEEEVPKAIAQTLEGLGRISVIVRSVKQFAHPGSTDMAAADLNEAMRSTVIVSSNEWKYVAELKTDLDPDLPLVECVIGEINQVVLNLIINAVHAIADAIQIDPQGTWLITLSTRQNGPWAEIRVTDTGMGIPPEVQPKIFEPFFTTKDVGKGTGQGLAIARRIVVEKHKGQLFFETEPGKGTTFIVRLPIGQRLGAE